MSFIYILHAYTRKAQFMKLFKNTCEDATSAENVKSYTSVKNICAALLSHTHTAHIYTPACTEQIKYNNKKQVCRSQSCVLNRYILVTSVVLARRQVKRLCLKHTVTFTEVKLLFHTHKHTHTQPYHFVVVV